MARRDSPFYDPKNAPPRDIPKPLDTDSTVSSLLARTDTHCYDPAVSPSLAAKSASKSWRSSLGRHLPLPVQLPRFQREGSPPYPGPEATKPEFSATETSPCGRMVKANLQVQYQLPPEQHSALEVTNMPIAEHDKDGEAIESIEHVREECIQEDSAAEEILNRFLLAEGDSPSLAETIESEAPNIAQASPVEIYESQKPRPHRRSQTAVSPEEVNVPVDEVARGGAGRHARASSAVPVVAQKTREDSNDRAAWAPHRRHRKGRLRPGKPAPEEQARQFCDVRNFLRSPGHSAEDFPDVLEFIRSRAATVEGSRGEGGAQACEKEAAATVTPVDADPLTPASVHTGDVHTNQKSLSSKRNTQLAHFTPNSMTALSAITPSQSPQSGQSKATSPTLPKSSQRFVRHNSRCSAIEQYRGIEAPLVKPGPFGASEPPPRRPFRTMWETIASNLPRISSIEEEPLVTEQP